MQDLEPTEVEAALRMAAAAVDEGLADAESLRERIRGPLAVKELTRARLVASLRNELGANVARMGGRIEDDVAIGLPDTLLFEVGSAEILQPLDRFLEGFCAPWLATIRGSDIDIDAVRIEGHASSEWGSLPDAQHAFVRNLDLSQRRAQAVLVRCLRLVAEVGTNAWARQHLTAAGFSSSRLLMVDGREDPEKSRRVVFSVSPNRQQLLDDIGDDIAGPLGEANRTVPGPDEARSMPANEHAFDLQRLSRL